jgi:hypothetical protein
MPADLRERFKALKEEIGPPRTRQYSRPTPPPTPEENAREILELYKLIMERRSVWLLEPQ